MKRIPLDVDYIVREYRVGQSIKTLAEELGVSRPVIRRRLVERAIELRSTSENTRLQMAALSPSERKAQVAAANEAMRGKPPAFHRRTSRLQAATKQRSGAKIGARENHLARLMQAAGIKVVQQQAFDVYNIDLGCWPVAVEVHVNSSHPHSHPVHRKRIEALLDGGWHVLYIKSCTMKHPLTERTAEQAVAFVKMAQRLESSRREYRVIRGSGEFIAAGRLDGDKLTVIPRAESLFDL